MSNQWHYSQDGAQYGPVDESEIIRLIQDGELAPGTPVLKVGSMDWQPARNHDCFQVEIFPRKKASKQVAPTVPKVTSPKLASGGASQSPRKATVQPTASSSPAVVIAPVQKSTVVPWVVAGVVSIALVVMAVAYFGLMKKVQQIGATVAQLPAPQQTNQPATNSVPPPPPPDTSKGEIPIVVDGDNIVINPAGSNGTRYLLVEIYLTRGNDSDKGFRAAIEAHTKMLKKITMDKLSSLDVQQCTDPSIRLQITYQLKAAYQEVLGSGHPIKDLILATWVMQ